MQDAATPVFLPNGEIDVPMPVGDSAWSDCLRDLKRTVEGSCLYVLSRGRCFSVCDPAKKPRDVSDKAGETAFNELVKIIGFEMQAQAMGLTTDATASGSCWHPSCVKPARHSGPCVDGFLRKQPLPEGCAEPLGPEILEGLVRRVAANISVIPGMEAVMRHSLPPALWQPSFIICIGSGQVRVLTLAFVGDPICGDKPTSKFTPFVLRLVTDGLVPATTDSHSPSHSHYCVRHALTGAETAAMHLADLAEELFTASATDDWTSITKVEMNMPPEFSINSSPAPQILIIPPEDGETPQSQAGTKRIRSPSPSPLYVQHAVSALADGLSAKAAASTWSVTGKKLGVLVAQARDHSPGWLRRWQVPRSQCRATSTATSDRSCKAGA